LVEWVVEKSATLYLHLELVYKLSNTAVCHIAVYQNVMDFVGGLRL
jgi:hypothetical protein